MKSLTFSLQDISKACREALVSYLENIPVSSVNVIFGEGVFTVWHGDSKSSTNKTGFIFQSKGIKTSGSPSVYRTVVTEKNYISPILQYDAPEKEDAETIVAALLNAVKK